jgi:hypothetical protein
MNVNRRERRPQAGAQRGAGQRVSWSGGRTAAERTRWGNGADMPAAARDSRARGVREFPTLGSAALRPREWISAVGNGRSARITQRPTDPAEDLVPRQRLAPVDRDPADRAVDADQSPVPRLKVAPPPPVTVPQAPFVGLILAVVVGGVLGILVVNTKINENSFRLDKLQKQQATLDLQQQQLEKEIARSEAPGNLTAQARKLGLVESGPPAFIRLPDGRVIGVPQPADGQPAITSQQGTGG